MPCNGKAHNALSTNERREPMTDKQSPRRIRVRGVRKNPPDLRALARAVIDYAQAQAEAEAQAQHLHDAAPEEPHTGDAA
jgi:hypothetical protein